MGSYYDWSTTAASNTTADSDVNWAEGQKGKTINNSAREMMRKIAFLIQTLGGAIETTGAANAYVAAVDGSTWTTLATGRFMVVKANHTNSGASTMNANTSGVKAIVYNGAALASGMMVDDGVYFLSYDSTIGSGSWRLLNPTITSTMLGAMPTTGGTFSGNVTHDGDVTFNNPVYFSDFVNIQGTAPVLNWYESDAGVDEKYWRFAADADYFKGQTVNDAYSSVVDWLSVRRVGTAVTEVNLAGTAVSIAGTTIGLTGATTVTGTANVSGTATLGAAVVASTTPNFYLNETDAGANEKYVRFRNNAGTFSAQLVDDAISAATDFITVERTGTTVDSVNIAGTAVQANGNTIWHAGNDGSGSTLDADLLDGFELADIVDAPITSLTTTSGTAHDATWAADRYSEIVMFFAGVSVNSGDNLLLRFSADASTYDATGYLSGVVETNGTTISSAEETTAVQLTRASTGTNTWNGVVKITGLRSGMPAMVQSMLYSASGTPRHCYATGVYTTGRTTRGLRLLSVGTFDAGAVYIYGKK